LFYEIYAAKADPLSTNLAELIYAHFALKYDTFCYYSYGGQTHTPVTHALSVCKCAFFI